jgi:hypothetical protein
MLISTGVSFGLPRCIPYVRSIKLTEGVRIPWQSAFILVLPYDQVVTSNSSHFEWL